MAPHLSDLAMVYGGGQQVLWLADTAILDISHVALEVSTEVQWLESKCNLAEMDLWRQYTKGVQPHQQRELLAQEEGAIGRAARRLLLATYLADFASLFRDGYVPLDTPPGTYVLMFRRAIRQAVEMEVMSLHGWRKQSNQHTNQRPFIRPSSWLS